MNDCYQLLISLDVSIFAYRATVLQLLGQSEDSCLVWSVWCEEMIQVIRLCLELDFSQEVTRSSA